MIFLLFIFNLVLFLPMVSGLVPLPIDALAGVYHPWAGQNWGFVAGIPYKNISLTDVFSQLYPWRELAMNLLRDGSWPLWNPFSFAGYPLLANWQSAPFYPLNILMIIFGNIRGYGLMVFLQPLLAGSFMYLFLRQIKLSKRAASLGALVSAYSGFVMTYLEYATTGQIMIWLPLILFFFEKYFEKKKIHFLAFSSLCLFPVLTGGFFQPAFYVLLIASLYWFFRVLSDSNLKNKFLLISLGWAFLLVGIAVAALQLLPTLELFGLSIRNFDRNIVEYRYGLLPVRNLITLFAPDFFGNPVTGNFWGFLQYQEATGYFSGTALILALTTFFSKKRDWRINLFSALFAISLVLAFDNSLSRLIYQANLPLLSTGYASRWLLMTAFSGAILSAIALDRLNRKKLILFLLIATGALTAIYFLLWAAIIPLKIELLPVALRNLVLPLVLLESSLFISLLVRNKVLAAWLLLGLVAFDLGRFGKKFTPFSSPEYLNRKLPVFEYLKNQNDFNRVTSEEGSLLPANTWMYNQLYSPAGYDPLLIKNYAVFFRGVNTRQNEQQEISGKLDKGDFTRYLNLVNPNSQLLDLLGVKYFLALKKDSGEIRPWGKINEASIDLTRYQPIFEDGATVVLTNKTALPRASLYYKAETEKDVTKAVERLVAGFDFRNLLLVNQESPKEYALGKDDTAIITNYSANKVELVTKTENGAYLLLTDTFYPGWQVFVNGNKKELLRAVGVLRAVEVGSGENQVEMVYKPASFKFGIIISVISLTTLLAIALTPALLSKLSPAKRSSRRQLAKPKPHPPK